VQTNLCLCWIALGHRSLHLLHNFLTSPAAYWVCGIVGEFYVIVVLSTETGMGARNTVKGRVREDDSNNKDRNYVSNSNKNVSSNSNNSKQNTMLLTVLRFIYFSV
jgi:hypothetical protein